jgi:hypothetical protein
MMSMKRTLVIAGLSLFSMVNVASAESRGRGGDCDQQRSVRSSNQIDQWNSRDSRLRDRADRRISRNAYGYQNDAYGYRGARDINDDRRDDDRSTAASVGIVAGSAAGGAAIGGLAGGAKGAAIGAIAGGAAGLVYDQATRDGNRDRNRRYRR